MQESGRDVGLVRSVGVWPLAAGIFSMIVGAGIFTAPAELAAGIGAYAPFVFLGCGLVMGAIAICFAEGGSRVATSGGVYGFVDTAFGQPTAFVIGTLFWVSCVLSNGGVAVALADLAATLFPPSLGALVHRVVVVGVVGSVALVNVGGVTRGSRLVAATAMLKLAPLVLFVVAGAAAVHGQNFSQTLHPDLGGLGRAMIFAVFTLMGMETSLCASGEVRDPSRTIPRALALALVLITVLYAAIQVVAQGILGSALASSSAPLVEAMARINTPLRLLMVAGAALSMFGYLSADILGSPRQLFALARDGLMPRFLGRVGARGHAPHVAILCYAALAIFLGLNSTFNKLAALSTLVMTPLYIGGCAAAWRLARRRVALAGEPLNFRFLGAAAAIGIVSMLTLIALGSPQEIGVLAGLIGASLLCYFAQTSGPRLRVILQRLR
jgi:basic amino acid/polyamine antiporter, APA family